MLKKQILRYY